MKANLHISENSLPKLIKGNTNPLTTKTDLQIWRMFKDGHEGAFNCIYEGYFHLLYRYGLNFCTDRTIIEDCIQDLFVDLRKSGNNLSDTNNIRFYLYKSFRWKIAYVLKKRRLLIFPKDTSTLFAIEFVPSQESILINNQFDKELKARLANALSMLPSRQKEAIYYFYFEDFSYEQLSGIMHLKSVKAARNVIYKAIINLRKCPLLISKSKIFSL